MINGGLIRTPGDSSVFLLPKYTLGSALVELKYLGGCGFATLLQHEGNGFAVQLEGRMRGKGNLSAADVRADIEIEMDGYAGEFQSLEGWWWVKREL